MVIKLNNNICRSISDIKNCVSKRTASFLENWFDNSDYIIAHTSGSTGIPKEIRLLKSDMKKSARMTNKRLDITDRSRLLLCLSTDYIAGKMMLVRALEANAEIIEETPSNELLSEYDGLPFDLVAVVPSQALNLVSCPEKLKYIKTAIIGGGAISEQLRMRIAECGIRAYSTYGMTETCSHVALAEIGAEGQPFKAMPSITFSVDNRNCLIINAPDFSFGQLTTNDIVELVDSRTFYWKGRYDNVINTGGIKVFPEDIERKIQTLFHCRFYITSRMSEKWGNEVILILETPEITEVEKQSILDKIKSVLPNYCVPKDIICIEHFNETASGKVIRERIVN